MSGPRPGGRLPPRSRRRRYLALLLPFLAGATVGALVWGDGILPGRGGEDPVPGLAAEYQAMRAKAGDFVLSPQAVAERMLARRPTLVLDVRSRAEFSAVHIEGSRRVALPDLMQVRGFRRPRSGTVVVVVDRDGTSAVEGTVFLRLAGVPAFAMSGGMDALRHLLTGPNSVRGGSPLARHPKQARGLLAEQGRRAPQPKQDRPPTTSPGAAGEPAGTGHSLRPMLVGLVAVALLLLGLGIWMRRRKPLSDAFAIIDADDELSFERATELLEAALAGRGLGASQRADAYYGLAYLRARLGQFDEASGVLARLPASVLRDPMVRYLDLWLKVRRRNYDEAVAVWDEASAELEDLGHGKLVASVALLGQGRAALASGDVDQALSCFDQVVRLGALTDMLPEGFDEYRVAVGVQSLFDGRLREAREWFKSARAAAEQDQKSTLTPQLGLLLCDWRANRVPDAAFERRLGTVVEEFEATAGRSTADDATGPPGANRLLLRDLLLWHAVTSVSGWRRLPFGRGLPQAERAVAEEQLRRARDLDPTMSDPDLLTGLLGCLFAADTDEHGAALDALVRACDHGANLPEVVLLAEGRRVATVTAAEGVEEYVALVKAYLSDRHAPLALRRHLQEHLTRFDRFRWLEESQRVQVDDEERWPSLNDLLNRGWLMRERVRTLVAPWLAGEAPAQIEEVTHLLDELDGATQSLSAGADAFARVEHRLVLLTGEFLLGEEAKGA